MTEALDDTTRARRARSTLLLLALLVVLGVILAAGLGTLVVLAGSLLDRALR